MNLSVELTPDQVAQLAREVAGYLRNDLERTPEPATYTPDQVAGLLGVCETTVRRRVTAGVIRKVPHLGSAIRIPAAEVRRLLSTE